MNINNNIHNIFSSNIAPNPIDVKYWADLNSDPSGMLIKVYKGGKWVVINGDSGVSNEIEELKETVNNKVDKVSGKQLSTNDYTIAEKQKLAGIAANANKTTVENVLTSGSTANALSAAQGKALKALIDSLTERVAALESPAA